MMTSLRPTVLAFCLVLAWALPTQAQNYGAGEGVPNKPDVVEKAAMAGDLNTLVTALKAAGLTQTLKGNGPFTIFAPSDAAFLALPEGTLADLLQPENKAKLQSILKYHVVKGRRLTARKLQKRSDVKTLQGARIGVGTKDKSMLLTGQTEAVVSKINIKASNGILHRIDSVLMPPEQTATMEEEKR
jgi:uncharacterized surface protein with fasciclin (FAS1) repeats